jgi:hypothetical protein
VPTNEIVANQRWKTLLRWELSDFSDAAVIDTDFVDDVKLFQVRFELPEDGVVGPLTYRTRLQQRLIDLKSAAFLSHRQNGFMATVGRYAATCATILWLEDIVDPPDGSERWERSRKQIDKLIRTEAGLGWHWEPPYEKDGDYEWCGTLPAYAYAAFVPVAIRKLYFSSTYRLDRFFRELPVHNEPPPKVTGPVPRLHVAFDEHSGPADLDAVGPQAGDFALVGGSTDGFGSHITMLDRWDGRELHTLEANAGGAGPRGNEREGVVRRTRPVGLKVGDSRKKKHLRRLLRLAPSDLVVPT